MSIVLNFSSVGNFRVGCLGLAVHARSFRLKCLKHMCGLLDAIGCKCIFSGTL